MHRHMNLLQGTQQPLQTVGQGNGRGGIGEQEGARDEHDDSCHHQHRIADAVIGNFELPHLHQHIALGVEHIEDGGKHDDENHRLDAL